MNAPVFQTGRGDSSPELPSSNRGGFTAEQKIRLYVELAIVRCGSAAALARHLKVRPPTVSEWRTERKRPSAVNLIHIPELGPKLSQQISDH